MSFISSHSRQVCVACESQSQSHRSPSLLPQHPLAYRCSPHQSHPTTLRNTPPHPPTQPNPQRFYNGSIAHLFIFDEALTGDQVRALYQTGVTAGQQATSPPPARRPTSPSPPTPAPPPTPAASWCWRWRRWRSQRSPPRWRRRERRHPPQGCPSTSPQPTAPRAASWSTGHTCAPPPRDSSAPASRRPLPAPRPPPPLPTPPTPAPTPPSAPEASCGLWAVGCGLWAVGCGLWAVGCGLWAAPYRHPTHS